MKSDNQIHVTDPLPSESADWSTPLFAAAVVWRERNGRWPVSFVTDITTTAADPRADGMMATLLHCGFAVHRHAGIDTVDSMLTGVRACGASLVLICARGPSDPRQVRPFVLAIPDVDFILVAGDPPAPEDEREGDPGSRGYYIDPTDDNDHLAYNMLFLSRSLGIAPR